jgi:hypothetical protein
MATKNGKYPDEGTLGNVSGPVLDKAGISDSGYLDKKGTPSGEGARFNKMPPGTNISNQECADIKRTEGMKVKEVTETSYPGDGW